MATNKSNPPSPIAGRRPLDSIDSLRPSSLPPELASLDMNWDDDPHSVEAIDLLQLHTDFDLDVDAGERTTAIPDIPMDQLVQATMAEADARESARAAATLDPTGLLDTSPLAGALDSPTPPRTSPLSGVPRDQLDTLVDPMQTQPAPPRKIEGQAIAIPIGVQPEPHEEANRLTPFRESAAPSRSPSSLGPRMSAPPTMRRSDVDDVRSDMKDRYATGDFSGALELAERLLEADTGDLEAQRFATSCRDVLTQMMVSRIGTMNQYVEVALSSEELRWLALDHRAGFFLSLVDGASTVEELLDISGMPRLESLRILCTLIDQRVLRLVPH